MTEVLALPDLDVQHLSATIGAVIRGVDLRDLTDAQIQSIREVWLDRKVVFFPGQHLDPDSHLAFAARFGTLSEGHPVIPGLASHPEIFEIDYSESRDVYANYGDVARKAGLDWHTDVTFVARPPRHPHRRDRGRDGMPDCHRGPRGASSRIPAWKGSAIQRPLLDRRTWCLRLPGE